MFTVCSHSHKYPLRVCCGNVKLPSAVGPCKEDYTEYLT